MTPAWESADILLHVGLHKTGTTLLEEVLFCRPGTPHFHAVADKRQLYGTTLSIKAQDIPLEAARAPLLAAAEAARADNRTLALLGETWAARPFVHPAIRTANLTRIRDLFPQARILVTIREQCSLIYSMYGQYIRFGYTNSLTEFLSRPPDPMAGNAILNYGFYDFARLHDECCAIFGPDRVLMLPFEMIFRDPAELLARFGSFIGRDLSGERLETGKKVNSALSPLALAVGRHANRFISRDTPWLSPRRRRFPNALAAKVDGFVPASLSARQQKAARAQVAEAVGDIYDASNSRIAARLDLDLEGYGYRCG
jgi:hypothetical protein